MPAPTELAIQITTVTCLCGHQWTHSRLLLAGNGLFGGTPSPVEETSLPLCSHHTSAYTTAHCHYCYTPKDQAR